MFINPNINIYNQVFICTLLNKIIKSFVGWSSSLESNILDMNILYPVDSNGQPDWEYMENYIKSYKNHL